MRTAGGTENAGVENAIRSKMQGWKMHFQRPLRIMSGYIPATAATSERLCTVFSVAENIMHWQKSRSVTWRSERAGVLERKCLTNVKRIKRQNNDLNARRACTIILPPRCV